MLIRALEPVEGLELMRQRRAAARWRKGKPAVADADLCRGPGNLTLAMGIDEALNNRPLFSKPLTIEDRGFSRGPIAWGPRIGITRGVEHEWRCYVAGHPSVSGKRTRPGSGT